ncbi:guanine deaminase [Kitasatospora sp. NPDC001225]
MRTSAFSDDGPGGPDRLGDTRDTRDTRAAGEPPAGAAGRCRPALTAVRGGLVWFRDDPFLTPEGEDDADALVYVEDGLLVCEDGKIVAAGDYGDLVRGLPPDTKIAHYRDKLILPGFVSTHVHYVQTRIIAAYGNQLLDWLKADVFPEEARFSDPDYARDVAALFCDELLRNGTTTALVNCATYPESVDALFAESVGRGMRLAAGKVLMDSEECAAPTELLDASPEVGYEQSRELIERWHGVGRSIYAVTPRFAVACTPGMLRAAGELWREYPGTLLQAHLAENKAEVEKVRQLFPECEDYVDVYETYGLLGPGAVFAHAVHLSKREWKRLYKTGSGVAHCPTSNLFLGSGLFDMPRATDPRRRILVGLGSDVGGGTSLSLLQTTGEAYKVGALRDFPMTGVKLFYLATVGSASAMRLDHLVGSLEPGHEADFIVLDPDATPLLSARTSNAGSLGELLFTFALMGDDRTVLATYLNGRLAHERDADDALTGSGREPVRRFDAGGGKRWQRTSERNYMRWTVYDPETGWSKERGSTSSVPFGPGIDVYKDSLWSLGTGGWKPFQMMCNRYQKEDDTWYTRLFVNDVEGDSVLASDQIAVQHANDFLYCVNHRTEDDARLWWTRYNSDGPEHGWSPHRPVEGDQGVAVRSTNPAATTVYDGLLYCVHDDEDGFLRWITHDTATATWGTDRLVPGDIEVARAPVVERFKNDLYCVHDRGGDELYLITYNSATDEWSSDEPMVDTDGNPIRTGYRPAIARFNDYLYCVYFVYENTYYGSLWWTRLHELGDEWSVPAHIPGTHSRSGLDLTPYYGGLYCMYRF